MQSDARELLARAKKWNAGIKAQFESVPLSAMTAIVPPVDMPSAKWI
jgi:hypothetical protein